jgi:hypothetical protein
MPQSSRDKAIHARRKNASPKGLYLIPTQPNKYFQVTGNGVESNNRGNPTGSFTFLKYKIVGTRSSWDLNDKEHIVVLNRDKAFEKIKNDKLRKVKRIGETGSLDLTRS